MALPKKVLVVDDSPTLREAVRYVLAREGLEVVQAEDSERALQMLQAIRRSSQVPALIITDIHMPKMNGIEFIRRMKESKLRYVPILVLTTETGDEIKKQAKEAGAAGWINKPFDEESLLLAVRRLTALPWKRN